MAKVVIDAGHGGNDIGTLYNNRREKDDNLRMSLAVGNILQNHGIDVIYTRTRDEYRSPIDRDNIVKAENADLLLTIARNNAPDPNSFSGVRAGVNSISGIAQEAAINILHNLEEIGFRNIGVGQYNEYYLFRDTSIPAILLALGYMNSDKDNELFDSKFDEIASAIADGVIETLNPSTSEASDIPTNAKVEFGDRIDVINHYVRRNVVPIKITVEEPEQQKTYKVVLDAGHGGNDPGDIYKGRMEKNDNLNLTFAVGKILESNGIEVIYTRDTDTFISPVERLKTAQKSNAALFVALHRMSDSIPKCKPGIEIFTNTIHQDILESAAENIIKDVDKIGFNSYGIKENTSDYLLRELIIPAIDISIGFIDSDIDNTLYDKHFNELAEYIASGIVDVFVDRNQEAVETAASIITMDNDSYRSDDGIRIILDAGHGGCDTGSVHGERLEKNDNLKLVRSVGELLVRNGVEVIYTRTGDRNILATERVNIANRNNGNLLISIHRMCGASRESDCGGVEFFVNEEGDLGEETAINVGDKLTKIGYHNHGVYTVPEVTILKYTLMPSVMCMIGFIDSDHDNMIMDYKFNEICLAIAAGILKTFGKRLQF